MIITCRAIVDDEGTIRLLESVKLKEGAHVLAAVVDRDALVWLYTSKLQSTKDNPYPICLCGCGEKNKPGSRFNSGHDAKLKSTLSRIKDGKSDVSDLPSSLFDAALNDPSLKVVGYTASGILDLVGKNRGQTAAEITYRGVVDGKGVIRLLNPVEFREGTHILVTLVDWDSLISPLGLSGRTSLPEERIREELLEDEAWAYLLKEVP